MVGNSVDMRIDCNTLLLIRTRLRGGRNRTRNRGRGRLGGEWVG